MRTSKIWGSIVLLLAMAAIPYARDITDGILVTVPHEVVVNEKRIAAGEYEFRKVANAASPIIRIYNRDEMIYETPVLPISVEKFEVEETPKLVLRKLGDDFYLTQIWIQPDRMGYEVPLPKRARALEKELERGDR